jgi:hypothetical protein
VKKRKKKRNGNRERYEARSWKAPRKMYENLTTKEENIK